MNSSKEVISNLKFICRIKKGDKINTRFMFLQPDGISTRVSRTFINYDNRQNTLNFVHSTITSAFDILNTYKESTQDVDMVICQHIMNDLDDCKNGLSHLKDTYHDDVKFCCDIDTLLQTVNVKLTEMNYKRLDRTDTDSLLGTSPPR